VGAVSGTRTALGVALELVRRWKPNAVHLIH
jgi:hypothetical protein